MITEEHRKSGRAGKMDQNEYTLPGIMNYLQNEFIQIEKIKISNNLEISEMKFKISKLESATNSLNSMNNKLVYENEHLKKDNLKLLNVIRDLKSEMKDLRKGSEEQLTSENSKPNDSQRRDEENLKKLISSSNDIEGQPADEEINSHSSNVINSKANTDAFKKSEECPEGISNDVDEELRSIIGHLSSNKSQTSLIKDLNLNTTNNGSSTSSDIDLTPLVTSRKFLQDCMKEMFYLIKNDQNQHQQQQQHSTINIFEKYNYLRDLKHFEMINSQNNNASNHSTHDNLDQLSGNNQKLNFDSQTKQQQIQNQQTGDNDYTLLLRTPDLIEDEKSNNPQSETSSVKFKEAPQIKSNQQQVNASSVANELDEYYDSDLETIINEDKSTPDPLMIHEKMDLLENDSIMESPIKTKDLSDKDLSGGIIIDGGSEYQLNEVVIDLSQLNKDNGKEKVIKSLSKIDLPFDKETEITKFEINENQKDILYVTANDKKLKRGELLLTDSTHSKIEFKEIKESSLKERMFNSVKWLNESTFMVYKEPTKISIYKDYKKVHSIDLFLDLNTQLRKLKETKKLSHKSSDKNDEEDDDDDEIDLLPLRDNTILNIDSCADKLLINCSKFYYIYDINTLNLIGFKSLTNIPLSLKFGKFHNKDDIFFIFNNNLIEMYNSKEDSEFVLLDNSKFNINIDNIAEIDSSCLLIRASISNKQISYYKFDINENRVTKKFTLKNIDTTEFSDSSRTGDNVIEVFNGNYLLQLTNVGLIVIDLIKGDVYKEFVYYDKDIDSSSHTLLFSWLQKEKGKFVLAGAEGLKCYII